MSVLVYIGLGSNLEQPEDQIRQAIDVLKKLPDSEYLKHSGMYLSRPMRSDEIQPDEQPEYYNAVAVIKTELDPIQLLDCLQAIENSQGRLRVARWGPRTIDLDILLYGQQLIRTERLMVPHPGLSEREFVVYPLQQLDPDLNIPGRGMLDDIVKKCPENGMKYLGAIV